MTNYVELKLEKLSVGLPRYLAIRNIDPHQYIAIRWSRYNTYRLINDEYVHQQAIIISLIILSF